MSLNIKYFRIRIYIKSDSNYWLETCPNEAESTLLEYLFETQEVVASWFLFSFFRLASCNLLARLFVTTEADPTFSFLLCFAV